MFSISRIIIQNGRDTIRRNLRQYCSAKNFKETTTSNIGQNQQDDHRNEYEDFDSDANDKQSESNNSNKTKFENQLIRRGEFQHVSQKDRNTFISMVHIFIEKDKHRRNHVEFIYAALKHMKEFGVERDLAVYKELIDVMPKGKFIAQNMFQAEFMHYPKQQNCIMDLLDQMEWNGVMGDREIEQMIANIFGRRSHPYYKFQRHMYWLPKFKHLNPWLLPNPVPDDALELAKLAVRQMCTVDVESVVEILNTKDVEESLDKTWIVSGQSPEQRMLLSNHPKNSPLKIEGPFTIWLRDRTIKYFTLIGDAEPEDKFMEKEDSDDVKGIKLPNFMRFMSREPSEMVVEKPKRSIHQQDDGTVYAICATGTSTKDSLLSWIRLLEKSNQTLADTPTLFKFRVAVDENAMAVSNNSKKSKA